MTRFTALNLGNPVNGPANGAPPRGLRSGFRNPIITAARSQRRSE
jgi:hypothetical protein